MTDLIREDNIVGLVPGVAPTQERPAIDTLTTLGYSSVVVALEEYVDTVSAIEGDITIDSDLKAYVEMDPLLALVMAGIEVQTETNALITALSEMSAKITEGTTNATTAGNEWLKDFYDHGIVGEGIEGIGTLSHTYEQDEVREVKWRLVDGENPGFGNTEQYFEMFDEINDVWVKVDANVDQYLEQGVFWAPREGFAEGYSIPVDAQADYYDMFNEVTVKDAGDGTITAEKDEWTVKMRGPAGTVKGGGVINADTANMNAMIQMWQAVQSKVSQVNNAFQTVSAIPGTMLQSLQSSVSTALSKMSQFLNASGTRVSLVNSWLSV